MTTYHSHLFEFLAHLNADKKPEFGKMSAQHMVEHLSGLYMIAIGKVEVPIFTSEEDLPKRKAFLMSNDDFPRNFKAPMLPEEPLPLRYENIEIAKDKLKKLWSLFNEMDSNNFEKNHPTFGKLNYNEWTIAISKHNKHHLLQFNLV